MMHLVRGGRSWLVLGLLSIVVAIVLRSSSAAAAEAAWHRTGDGVMRTRVAFIPVDVFAVGHDMKCLPDHKSKAEVIASDCDKRFVWRALRNIDKDDIRDSLRQAYHAVDYRDAGKVERALSIFASGIKEGESVTISYDAAGQRTIFAQKHGGSVDISGVNFMKATWSLVFANGDMNELGDALLSRL
jgi:hypothetical protein